MNTLSIEMLAVDLGTCTRCVKTAENLEAAVTAATPALKTLGISPHITKRVVASLAEAEALRFTSSPTVRINGIDIMSTTSETPCDSCADLCGCDGGIDCRVWPWRGETHEAAPVGLIAEAILRTVVVPPGHVPTTLWQGVPENLRRFFGAATKKEPCCAPSCCAK